MKPLFERMQAFLAEMEDDGRSDAVRALARRGARFADDLLAYAGRGTLSPQRVEPAPLLCGLAETLRHVLDARIDVQVHVDSRCPPCRADPDALEGSLLKLILNARDAMPWGGLLLLAARPARMEDGSPALELAVQDRGHGMTDALDRTATRPFVTTKQDDPMAGLGLAAAEGFARQSGGFLLLRSFDSGTMASLVLPAEPTPGAPSSAG